MDIKKYKEYQKQYYQKNKDKLRKRHSKYIKKYKAKQLEYMETLATAIVEIFKDREREKRRKSND